jgi:hypothetical protein
MAKLNVYLPDSLSEWLEERKSRSPVNVSRILQRALTRELDREIYLDAGRGERRVRNRILDVAGPDLANEELGHSYVIGCELALRWASPATRDDLRELASPRTLGEELAGELDTPEAQRLKKQLGERPDQTGTRDDARHRDPVVKEAMRAALREAAERGLYEFSVDLARRGFLDTIEEIARQRRDPTPDPAAAAIQYGRFAARSWLSYAPRSAWPEAVALVGDDDMRLLYPAVADDYREESRHVEKEIETMLQRVETRAEELDLPRIGLGAGHSKARDAFVELVAEQWEAEAPKRRLFHIDAEAGADAAAVLLADLTDGQKTALLAQLAIADLTPDDLADEAAFVEAHHRLPDAVEHALWQAERETRTLNRFRFLLGFAETVWREPQPDVEVGEVAAE